MERIRWRVRELLTRKRMTQKQLAQAAQLTESQVSHIANGRYTRVDFATLACLCAALKVPVGRLLEYVPDQKLPA